MQKRAYSEQSQVRVIKKYSNRRLYDTYTSSYIKLDDIRELVMNDTPFLVIDSKNKKDITTPILLHILLESEQEEHALSAQTLQSVIRSTGGSSQSLMQRFLEYATNQFMKKRNRLQNPLSALSGSSLGNTYALADDCIKTYAEKEEQLVEEAAD